VGFLPFAPGTWGSLFAIPVFVLFSCFASSGGWAFGLLCGSSLALFGIGTWASGRTERVLGQKDDGRIVIDEVVGQLLALAPLSLSQNFATSLLAWDFSAIALLVTGFVAFRCFDITKPGPVGWAERRFQGGLGVMLDDALAGLMAALVVVPLLTAKNLL